MIRVAYQSMFVFLSGLLMAVFFVMQPTDNADMKKFQAEVRVQLSVASQQVLGDQNISEPFAFVWNSVAAFYDESANQTIALLENENLSSLALMFDDTFQLDYAMATAPVVGKVAYEEPIYNIVPMAEAETLLDPYFNEDMAFIEEQGGRVAGESITVDEQQQPEEEQERPSVVWVTITDSITGYPFCVAVFNTEINSYPGVCATEDEMAPVMYN